MCTWRGTKNLITAPKLHWSVEYWRLGKMMWMAKWQRQKYKLLQSVYNLMHELEQVPKGVMQKQT